MKITEYKNITGIDCILVEYDDDSSWSGLKSTYDEMIAQSETAPL